MDDDLDDYERTLSPFGKFVHRTERRIRHYELRAKLAEAMARAAAGRAKLVRKGRSRRPSRADPQQNRAHGRVDAPGSKTSTGANSGKSRRGQNHTPGKR